MHILEVLEHIDPWKKYNLDTKDLEIFLTLQQDPLLSGHAISKKIGMRSQEVRTKIRQMKQNGFFRSDSKFEDEILGTRQQTEVESLHIPSTIGLNRYHVIINGIQSKMYVKLLQAFAELYPYTNYYSKSFTHTVNLYFQFDIPINTKNKLLTILNYLKEKNLYNNFDIFESSISKNSSFNPIDYAVFQNKIRYLQKNNGPRLSSIELMWRNFDYNEINLEEPSNNKSINFDKLDLLLIRELNINGIVPTKFLAGIYGKTSAAISMRLKSLRENVVRYNDLVFDRSIFNTSYLQIFTGRFDKEDRLNANTLSSFITSLPFRSSIVTNENRFLWYLQAPPHVIPEFTEFISDHSLKFNIHQLNTKNSKRYYLNTNNYEEKGKWKTNDSYMIDNPKREIENILDSL